MATLEEKISLLSEMISFSIIDGILHDREYQFILLIARELRLEKAFVDSLFHEERKPVPIKLETDRIQQFYRLALLMHIDGILHEKENNALHEIGIKMGLNPQAMDKILKLMKSKKDCIISPQQLFLAFESQHN
jgi:hypothetical protein